MQQCGMQNRHCPNNRKRVSELHASGEDYLVAVFILQRKNGSVRCIDLVHHTGYTRPSISHAVTLLQKGGFLNRDMDGCLHLTTDGWHVAEQIYEKRSFFMSLLMQAGVDFQTAQRDACRIEHDISEDSFQKLKHALKNNGNI